jgi:hypothetical protein
MAKDGDHPGFVVRQPVLDSVAETLETDLGIVCKVWNDAVLVEPSAISLEQGLG